MRRCRSSTQRDPSLAGLFAGQLRQLHKQAKEDPHFKIRVLDSFGALQSRVSKPDCHKSSNNSTKIFGNVPSLGIASARKQNFSQSSNIDNISFFNFPSSVSPSINPVQNKDSLGPATYSKSSSNFIHSPPVTDCNTLTEDNLSDILNALGDAAFTDMDRVISFSDLDFT